MTQYDTLTQDTYRAACGGTRIHSAGIYTNLFTRVQKDITD